LEQRILEHFPKWLAAAAAMTVEPPIILLISLLNVRGYTMAVPVGSFGGHPILREHVNLPGSIIESLTVNTESPDMPHSVFALLRPHFDVLWNACGFSGSVFFDDKGNRKHQNRF
jgi:hypothetical protein